MYAQLHIIITLIMIALLHVDIAVILEIYYIDGH